MVKYLDSLSRRRGKQREKKQFGLVRKDEPHNRIPTHSDIQPIPLLSALLCVLAARFYQFKRRNE